MAARSVNTMGEVLSKIMGDIAEAKALPDADLPFLLELETRVLKKRREPIDALEGANQVPDPGMFAADGGQPPMPGGGQGAMPTFPTGPSGGVPGLMQGPAMPNEDELGRLVGG